MFVHRTGKDRTDTDVVVQRVRDQTETFIYPVHRLDRATSGIVLLAFDQDSASEMGAAFAERRVSKTYQAIARGHCAASGRIVTPLISARGRGKPTGHPHAAPQKAETEFHTIRHFEFPVANERYPATRCSLVNIYPHTGRFHQIRRHFNYESHPIIGDSDHGDSRHNRIYRETFGLDRMMLAAVELRFQHPVSGEQMLIKCPPDVSFRRIIDRLTPFQC